MTTAETPRTTGDPGRSARSSIETTMAALRSSDLRHPSRWWSHRQDSTAWAWGLAVLCVVLLGMRQSFLLRGTGGMSPTQFAVVSALGIVVCGVLFRGDVLPRPPVVLGLVLVVVILSTLVTYGAATARGIRADELLYVDHTLFARFIGIAVVVLTAMLMRTPRAVIIVLRGAVVAGAVSACYALVQIGVGLDLAPYIRIPGILKADTTTLVTDLMRAGTVRPQGAAGHPLELSAVLTVLVPIAAGIALHAYARRERWWPWGIACLTIIGGALSTVSRSAVVGITISLVVFACVSPVRRTLATAGTLVIVVGLALLFRVPMVDQLYQVITGGSQDNSLGSRAYGAAYVGQHFTDHLWFGQGIGTYNLEQQPVLDNEYLGRLMESGVTGLVAFAAILMLGLVSAAIATIRALRRRDRALTDLAASVVAALAALAAISSILDISGFAQISTLMYILIGISVAMLMLSRADPSLMHA